MSARKLTEAEEEEKAIRDAFELYDMDGSGNATMMTICLICHWVYVSIVTFAVAGNDCCGDSIPSCVPCTERTVSILVSVLCALTPLRRYWLV